MSNKAPTFQEFWNIYPLHVSKKRAEGAWNRLTAKEKRLAIAAIPAYVAYIQTMPAPSYKTPQGWLNDRRWEDELDDSGTKREHSLPPVQTDLQSGCTEYKDLQSDSRITNAHTRSDGIANPAERPAALPDGMDKW